MFRIETFCDDKNLSKVYRALAGIVIDIKVQPVANAKKGDGTVNAKTSGDKVELFCEWVKRNKFKTVTPSQLKDFSVEIGNAPNSYGSFLPKLIKAKVIRKVAGTKGNGIKYAVTV